jgi:superfamily II DNA or RNA helicase
MPIDSKIFARKFLNSTGFPGSLKAIEGFLAAFEKGILPVLLTTTGLFDEGANLPAIRRLIMGDGLKSLRLVLQKCGRALRRKKGQDNTVEVYDYMDVFNEWLAGHSLERLNIYEKEGFEVIEL